MTTVERDKKLDKESKFHFLHHWFKTAIIYTNFKKPETLQNSRKSKF